MFVCATVAICIHGDSSHNDGVNVWIATKAICIHSESMIAAIVAWKMAERFACNYVETWTSMIFLVIVKPNLCSSHCYLKLCVSLMLKMYQYLLNNHVRPISQRYFQDVWVFYKYIWARLKKVCIVWPELLEKWDYFQLKTFYPKNLCFSHLWFDVDPH